MKLYEGFVCHPSVCAVGKDYQILVPVNFDMLLSAKIGDREFFNHSNGIRISSSEVQRITVPQKVLDEAKSYTLVARKMVDRKPYFPVTEEAVEITYSFKPLEKTEKINIYQVADAHGVIDESVKAGRYYGEDVDLILLNGDVMDSSSSVEVIEAIFKIASGIGEGHVPCVMSRGNHDLRGICAERLASFMPNYNGKSYYTFRVGCIWGILIDCGEDKPDANNDYGHTICCHQFRLEETEFIKEVIENAKDEYEAPDVKYRLVISHNPFAHTIRPPFDIEQPLFAEWCKLLKENIHPDLMLCGHLHCLSISEDGGPYDQKGQPCITLIGSNVKINDDGTAVYTGMGVTLNDKDAKVVFNSNEEVLGEHTVKFR